MPEHNGSPISSTLLVSFHINKIVLCPCTWSNSVGGSMRGVALQIIPQRRRKHLQHQLGNICLCSVQFSLSLRQRRTHPGMIEFNLCPFLLAFRLQHLPCSTEDGLETQHPAFLFWFMVASTPLTDRTQAHMSRPQDQRTGVMCDRLGAPSVKMS